MFSVPDTAKAEAEQPVPATKQFQQALSKNEFDEFMQANESYQKASESYAEQILDLEMKFRQQTQHLTHKRGEYLQKLPGFWAQAMLNHKDIKPFCEDQHVRDFMRTYLADVELVFAFDNRFGKENLAKFGREGVVIKCEYKDNPAFFNQFITKAFGKRVNEDNCEIAFCEGTQISWKCDKLKAQFLGETVPASNAPGIDGDDTDDEDDNVDWFSFFGWWQLSTDELSDDHQLDENGMDKFAKAIIDDIWSVPVEWYDLVDNESEEEEESDDSDDDESEDDEML